ncbi:MAG: translational GTPase TypA [Deltaproteobacteria bacterium]|nr:translational GTPase TypA [Deltaproteobacteria bacterium]
MENHPSGEPRAESAKLPVLSVAIIAHVDHGKTTLLDHMLRQSGSLDVRKEPVDRVMDSDPQERERGITILAKCTAVRWHDRAIQIVDTPGHQDFGGEVERILRMVDSVLLLVDAVEGPMPQTRYVLQKSLEHGYRPIVVINKMDRPEARPDYVANELFDLFSSLGASDEQMDFPMVYAAGRDGWASLDPEKPGTDLLPLFETIVDRVPPPAMDVDAPLQLQVSTLDYSDYLGRIAIGRIHAGTIERGMRAVCCRRDGSQDNFRVTKLMGFLGLKRVDCERAEAGEIVALAGVDSVTVGETLCAHGQPNPLPMIPIDEPTISMRFGINNSPFAGTDGRFVTSRQLRERLHKELEHNVGLRLETTERKDFWRLFGRGTLHLSVLFETMRREGYEMSIGQPQVVMRDGEEPYEQVVVTVPNAFAGAVIEKLSRRGGALRRHEVDVQGTASLELMIPSRGLIGYRGEFLTDTRGEGIIYSSFSHYDKSVGEIKRRENGVMIAQDACETITYGMHGLQDRGKLFLPAGVKVYGGQIVGLHSRSNDLVVNPGRKKQLTNVRSSGHDDALRLIPCVTHTLEQALELIADDELVELTPKAIRIRKRTLDHNVRKREEKVLKGI